MLKTILQRIRVNSITKGLHSSAIILGRCRNIIEVDLRSDTLTKPTEAMRKAMAKAEVADDIYDGDPTAQSLERRMAEMLGQEAGLFVMSGTMANLLAVMTHCNSRGSEAIVGHMSHVFLYEQGAVAQIAGVQTSVINNEKDGTLNLDVVERRINDGSDNHNAITNLICIENTHCDVGGYPLPKSWLDKLSGVSRRRSVPVHVDGARLLNASVACNTPMADLARDFSSTSICLSKGIGAPYGSILAGNKSFVELARRYRKAIGGAGRQVGVLAAAAHVALDEAEQRIQRDHRHAAMIAEAVTRLGSKYVITSEPKTNIILLQTKCISAQKLASRLNRVSDEEESQFSNGDVVYIKCIPLQEHTLRLVTHSDISEKMIEKTIRKLSFVIQEIEENLKT